jgi:hypothetical protein
MSTIGLDSWAADLKDIGAIYPFQGGEVIFFILGLVFWIGWHVIQLRAESKEIDYEIRTNHRAENIHKSIKRY